MHLRNLFLILLLSVTTLAYGEIFKTIDENGNVVYTNTPRPDQKVEKVDLPPINEQPAIKAKPYHKKSKAQAQNYEIGIIQPLHDEVFFTGELTVKVITRPSIPGAMKVALFMNGEPAKIGPAGDFKLTELHRGSYKLQAIIIDKQGNTVSQSNSPTIHIKKHSRLNKPTPKAP